MSVVIDVGSSHIGKDHPCFIIAEAGVNHNGDLGLAKDLVEVASRSGADAVKFQTFTAERLAISDAPKALYQIETTGTSETQYEMLKRLELTATMHQELSEYCRHMGILFLSSPFDELSADFLNEIDVPAFKIPSGEITNHPLLDHIARKGKPMIVSTGMADIGETDQALKVINAAGNHEVILLHCVSNYPADPVDINLKAMQTLDTAFGVPVGFSDHTVGIDVALGAVALGAKVLEKHFTLDINMSGPDHRASLEPDELNKMVNGIRNIEKALGDGIKIPAPAELDTALVARKSLVTSTNIEVGTVLTRDLITAKRPGTGLPPSMQIYLLGRTAKTRIPKDTLIDLDMLS